MVAPTDAAKSAALAGQAASNTQPKAEERAPPAAVPMPSADRADIRPLDIPGALQILIGEVRLELDAVLLSMGQTPAEPRERADNPQKAVQSLVESLLDVFLKESLDFAAFDEAVSRVDSAWQRGSARALDLVSAWKEVPDGVLDSVKGVIAQSARLIDTETVNPLSLRAEWLGLAPRLERYRRRRRRLRRWLTDPDFKAAQLDEDSEPPR